MNRDPNIYATKALSQIPRLLSQLDRNPYSPTYGSFDRSYWHDKASDFSNADQQLGAHSLALVYKLDFPGNTYKNQSHIRDWAIASIAFLASIQHSDGSFDEHYPFERGWAGPTAFLVYYVGEAFRMLSDEMSPDMQDRVRTMLRRSAYFLIKGESEEDRLANHHALACLAIWKASELLHDPALAKNYDRLWAGFLKLYDAEEGWSMEYDGADPGYLSATVSFLAKIEGHFSDPRLQEVLRKSVAFCSYFVYPNGEYGGSVGSRNTSHFYPHGFEILARTDRLAQGIAEKLADSLEEGKLVPPEIMSDRYMVLRLSEYLLAHQAFAARTQEAALLPFEQEPFTRYFSRAQILITNQASYYLVAHLGKGGVLHAFHRQDKRVIFSDAGLWVRLSNGSIATSQWINPRSEIQVDGAQWNVKGMLQIPPPQRPFTLLTSLLFRTVLFLTGWCAPFSHWLKGRIRRAIMLDSKPSRVRFSRKFSINENRMTLQDEIALLDNVLVSQLSIGEEFPARHVPQSQYFSISTLGIHPYLLNAAQIQELNQKKILVIHRELNVDAS